MNVELDRPRFTHGQQQEILALAAQLVYEFVVNGALERSSAGAAKLATALADRHAAIANIDSFSEAPRG